MNKKLAILTLLAFIVFITVPVNLSQQASYTPQDYLTVLTLNRQINVNTYGQIIINDTMLIANNGSTQTNYIIIGNHADFNDYLYYISGESDGTSLQVSDRFTINSNISGYALILPQALTPTSTVKITVTLVYSSLIISKGVGQYSLTIPRYPILPYNITQLSAKITTPGARTTPTYSTYTASNLTAYNYTSLKIEYTYSGTPLAEYNLFQRSLEVNPWLGLKITDKHNITILNTGVSSGITQLPVNTLPHAQRFRVYDDAGLLSFDQNVNENITVITVKFRYTVYSNQSYIFYVEYWLPTELYRGAAADSIRLQTNPPQYTTKLYSLNIILSASSTITSYNTPSGYTVQTGFNTLTITRENITAYNTGAVEFTYTLGFTDLIGRPLLITAITGILLTAFLYWKIRTGKEKAAVELEREKPKELISEFCKLYEDKAAIIERLDRLEVDYLKGKIRRLDYQKRKTTYINELGRLDRELKPLKEELSKAGAAYSKTVSSLERLELERDNAQRQLEDLRYRYREKRITTATYTKIKEELEKKIMKISQDIDKKIIGLRQEAS